MKVLFSSSLVWACTRMGVYYNLQLIKCVIDQIRQTLILRKINECRKKIKANKLASSRFVEHHWSSRAGYDSKRMLAVGGRGEAPRDGYWGPLPKIRAIKIVTISVPRSVAVLRRRRSVLSGWSTVMSWRRRAVFWSVVRHAACIRKGRSVWPWGSFWCKENERKWKKTII